MSISKRLLALAISACVAAPVMAQESLIDVYRRALENDPAIREAEATYLATAEVKPQARSVLLPGLTLGAVRSNRYQDQAGGGIDQVLGVPLGNRQVFDQDTTGWSVSLTQTVFDWSQYATLRQADKQVVRAETDYQAAQAGPSAARLNGLFRRPCGRRQSRVGGRGPRQRLSAARAIAAPLRGGPHRDHGRATVAGRLRRRRRRRDPGTALARNVARATARDHRRDRNGSRERRPTTCRS